MKKEIKEKFLVLWEKYFAGAELPIVFYYTKKPMDAEWAVKPKRWSCLIGELARVRKGRSVAYRADAVSCLGAKRYLGFSDEIRSDFDYFLSCGNEKTKGEMYKQSPEIVREMMKNQEKLDIGDQCIVFKRWDKLGEADEPDAVIFFARPDVLSGLFTLGSFDKSEPFETIAPFGAGCSSIVHYPYLEVKSENPRAVIGMFDISARPYVPEDVITFAVPMKRFEKMIGFMEESFLATGSWEKIRKRIKNSELKTDVTQNVGN